MPFLSFGEFRHGGVIVAEVFLTAAGGVDHDTISGKTGGGGGEISQFGITAHAEWPNSSGGGTSHRVAFHLLPYRLFRIINRSLMRGHHLRNDKLTV